MHLAQINAEACTLLVSAARPLNPAREHMTDPWYYSSINPTDIDWIETDPGGVIAAGRNFHEQMRISREEQVAELAFKSQEHWKEMKPAVLRYNPRGYPKLQYFCKV